MTVPALDKEFQPMIKALESFDAKVRAAKAADRTEIAFAVERSGGYNYVYRYTAFADGVEDELNYRIAERLVKSVLWVVGGYKIYFSGSRRIYERLKAAYTPEGARAFDADFMSGVYEKPFEVVFVSPE